MRPIRHEHRTLPVLITLGVLLGAGLALASPGGHRSRGSSPALSVSVSASPVADPSSTAVSPSPASPAGDRPEQACGPVEPLPGRSAGHVPLVHAFHVMAPSCSNGRGTGLPQASVQSNEHGSGGRSEDAVQAAGTSRDVVHGTERDGDHGGDANSVHAGAGGGNAGGSAPDRGASGVEHGRG